MSFWNVLLVIIVILAILLVVLYILGSRMQKRQAEQQTMIDASKQTVSILAIDKKKLKIGDSGLPKMVIDQTPWYMKWAKLPIVKAKIGPKVVTMIADEKVKYYKYNQIYQFLYVNLDYLIGILNLKFE